MIFVVDVEADGPAPFFGSMIQIGAVHIGYDLKIDSGFDILIKPMEGAGDIVMDPLLSNCYSLEWLIKLRERASIEGCNQKDAMINFYEWIRDHSFSQDGSPTCPIYYSDNNGFDFAFTHWYFIKFIREYGDPFGHSSRNISDIYKGLMGNMRKNFKSLRKTPHTHNAIDDAMGNAEALIEMVKKYGLKIF